MRRRIEQTISAAIVVASLCVPAAVAQAPRTFVSATGSDSNPCSRIAPCRNFQAAMTAVAAGGEVVALDSAGYGPFTVDRAVTVTSDGVHAAITSLTAPAITLSTGTSDIVVLRNLAIEGFPQNLNHAIDASGFIRALFVENCQISNIGTGVHFEPANSPAEVHVSGSAFRDITGHGVAIAGTGVTGTITDSTFEMTTGAGVLATAGGTAFVRRCVATGSAGTTIGGFAAFSGGATLDVVDSASFGNGAGVTSDGAGSIARIANTTITNNTNGITNTNGATMVSMTGNHLFGNGTDGLFTSTDPQQ